MGDRRVHLQHVRRNPHQIEQPRFSRRPLDGGHRAETIHYVSPVFSAFESRFRPATVEGAGFEKECGIVQGRGGGIADPLLRHVHQALYGQTRKGVDHLALLQMQQKAHQFPRGGVTAAAGHAALAVMGKELALPKIVGTEAACHQAVIQRRAQQPPQGCPRCVVPESRVLLRAHRIIRTEAPQ